MTFDLSTQTESELVPAWANYPADSDKFAGIYCDDLLPNPFVSFERDEHSVVLDTIFKNISTTIGTAV